MRSIISSQHHRPPNYLIGGHQHDPLLLKEWALVLRGDGKSPRTIDGYADSVRQLAAFLERGGFPSLTEATAEHVREWLNELRNRGNKAATVNTRYRGVHAFYKWLVEEGEVRENPLARIQPPQVPETVQPYYTPEDLQLVLRSLRGRRLRGIDATRTRAAILVLFDTGLRASKLCSLRLEDLNWDAQSVLVRHPLELALRRAFELAGVEFKGIHAFRRASGIEYLRQGGQAEDLRVLMGWRSPEMIRRYVRAAEVERATAAHKRFSPSDHLEL